MSILDRFTTKSVPYPFIHSAKQSVVQEDDWLAWKSARSMLADWQKTYKDLDHKTSEVT